VWNTAFGQSTLATQHVRANLFYRRLVLLRHPAVGDTLRTTTKVVALRENTRREQRPPTGLAVLRVRTVDQRDRAVLDFYRCAMLPMRSTTPTGRDDDVHAVGAGAGTVDVASSVENWDLSAWSETVADGEPVPEVGEVVEVVGGDVVGCAPELARLTLNVASVHHDKTAAGGPRLVYGGHTIGIALAQVSRAFPDILTVLAWDGCDHNGPVLEGDTLRTRVTIEAVQKPDRLRQGSVVTLRAEVTADPDRPVLDWRFRALFP
jgi:acyl dehydratase